MLVRTWKTPAAVAGLALVVTATPAVAGPLFGDGRGAAAAATASATSELLSRGDRGEAVRAWQQVLNRAVAAGVVPGPALAVDGVFGPATARATAALQRRLGATPDGIVGPVTRGGVAGVLDGAAPAPARPPAAADRLLRSGVRGADVQAWQRAVNRAVDAGRVDSRRIAEDGVFGPATRRATIAVQAALGVTRDGIVGPVTRDGLAGLVDA